MRKRPILRKDNIPAPLERLVSERERVAVPCRLIQMAAWQQTCHGLDEGRFPGAVQTNQPDNFMLPQIQREAGEYGMAGSVPDA